MKHIDLLIAGLSQLDIEVNNQMIDQFNLYYDLLIEWNTRMNLTAITDEKDVISKHFLDSLLLVKSIDLNKANNVLDIGTGAGFPGIPLKIVYPHINLVLLDSVNKKIQFLETLVEQLDLKNVQCIHGRAEDYAREDLYREKFDIVVSRAVSNLSTLSEYCIPFVKEKAFFISYKSADYELELEDARNAIHKLGGYVQNIDQWYIPETDIMRTCVCIQKNNKTPELYPRKAGIPAKKPL